ncbi:GNAT family N-acetyltransferase [Streptomyces sp. NBC_00102]|uniref:GNAT family N-acetyltransferase n=1 Tax=Streptomyces sp. NBC_00102 TaxID=2975652 RepID=UPI00224E4FD2|nr:GNAT family protein [Streptomyces sp. NBC_00102]MCX5402238.1 GNAT family N-acetyltransferase [Streptomyces sp. NBC_00102]
MTAHVTPSAPSGFAVKPVLVGERALLRPFSVEDTPRMIEILEDPEVVRFTFDPGTELTPELLRAWYGSRNAQDDRLDLAVTDRATGELVGEVVLNEWSPAERACSFRTLIAAAGRGRGLGTEATRLIVGHAFESLGLRRVSLEAYSTNHRALRVYRKVGFQVVGVRPRAQLREGVWNDETLMAVTADEWSVHRGRP